MFFNETLLDMETFSNDVPLSLNTLKSHALHIFYTHYPLHKSAACLAVIELLLRTANKNVYTQTQIRSRIVIVLLSDSTRHSRGEIK